MSIRRARGWILFLAVAAYLNTLGNGFAYDDNAILEQNDVVTEAHWSRALMGPYWPRAGSGSGLYRPVTVTSFAAEWQLWDGRPAGFHAVSVLVHALVSLLVLALLLRFVSPTTALVGAAFFALHPVHVEAVANVVGRSELYATAAVLAACLLYLHDGGDSPWRRAARLGGLSGLYLLGLGSKEIAVTLPGLLLLLEACRPVDTPLFGRLRRELPVFVSLAAVLAAYLLLRVSVLGTLTGEVPAPALRGLTTSQRELTALTAWPQYLRLMVFPRTLSADYSPGVMMTAHAVNGSVVLGGLVLLAWLGGAVATFRRAPVVCAGLVWFAIAVLPVSNLVVPAGILLAERTLYLPSVGAALVVAGVAEAVRVRAAPRTFRLATVLAGVGGLAFMVRTVERNPTWMSTYVVLNTLAMEHPESYLSLRRRASGLVRVGEPDRAARYYDLAVSLAPNHYGLLTEVAAYLERRQEYGRAEQLLRRAIEVAPDPPTAYRLLANMRLRQGRGREAHAVALQGLAAAGPDRELWSIVSEAYIAKGDLEAAVRARRAALGQDPESAEDWKRLGDLLEALHRPREAAAARSRAHELGEGRPVEKAGIAPESTGEGG